MKHRYIFVVGGVMSSVGKGIATASIGRILQARGLRVTAMKIDPYINIDAGTMNPIEHGEVFVTDDADETDQDLGNYERFLGTKITSINYMTTGRVYESVIHRERNLEYDGKCVQVVPHIPYEVISRIKNAAKKNRADITIIEVGGTVGEYENILFLEAARMMKLAEPDSVLTILVSYLPIPSIVGEMKTKPTQHAARALSSAGLQADFIIGRAERPLDNSRREKIATFCNIAADCAISSPDVESIYEVPLLFEREKLSSKILKKFRIRARKSNLNSWKNLVKRIKTVKDELKIAVVGKYFGTGDFTLADSYVSVIEAIKHSAWKHNLKPKLTWVDSEDFEDDSKKVQMLNEFDGVIVPGGFGSRGIEGIIRAITYTRENKIPYLGLCYGMQLAAVEFARNVAKLKAAHTTEVKPKTKHKIIDVMPDQIKILNAGKYGGTMRLGAYACKLTKGSIAGRAYGKPKIIERHRHRYEFNNQYRKKLQSKGLVISGVSPDDNLVEIIELKHNDHPFFVATQFHPEFLSNPLKPHPLFDAFVGAAKAQF